MLFAPEAGGPGGPGDAGDPVFKLEVGEAVFREACGEGVVVCLGFEVVYSDFWCGDALIQQSLIDGVDEAEKSVDFKGVCLTFDKVWRCGVMQEGLGEFRLKG